MGRGTDIGSLTKEFPLDTLDETIQAIRPGMSYAELREVARERTHRDVPGLIKPRWLLVESDGTIAYDRFLSLVNDEGLESRRVRKVMYFVWAFRDERLRRFICQRIAGRDGIWRVTELTRKANAEFFEEWFESATAPKVRSNIERFFVETGIYDEEQQKVHLGLNDGWLVDGMRIAAQHERNGARRRAMTNAPIDFLIANGWHGLANATAEELRGISGRIAPEPEPLEDSEIDIGALPQPPGMPWNRRRPALSARQSTTAFVDLVARERANLSHHELERITADAARAKGYKAYQNKHMDMYFETPSGSVLAEMKSCHRNNLHIQIRRGVSQLFEYRFAYRSLLGSGATPVLIMETKPSGAKAWLIDYLESIGITLAWQEAASTRLVTTSTIPPSLHGIVFPSE